MASYGSASQGFVEVEALAQVMLSANSVRAHIAAMLSGELTLDDFEDWIVSSSWNVLRHADAEVRQLVGVIELRLAEYSSGHLDHADLITELQALRSAWREVTN